MKFLFFGDIMPGGVLPYQDKYIDEKMLKYIHSFDFRIGTLECSIGTNIAFDTSKMASTKSIVFARDEDMFRLQELHLDVVSLANNHAFDLGLTGMENTIRLLDNMGIKHCGAGHNLSEAKKPAIIEINNKRIAFIGCLLNSPRPVIFHKATESSFGVYQVDIENLEQNIRELKSQYDYVVVMPHWCEEHSFYPPAYCKDSGKKMIDAGADAVVGSHPHIINPVIKYKNKYIYFSLGNFLFPDKCMQVPRPMYYPKTREKYLSLKRMWTYPKNIIEPIVAVWKPKNRIGMMVEMDINKEIKSHYNLTCLTADNVLHPYSSIAVNLRMAFWALIIQLPKYEIIIRLYNHHYNLFRRIMDKLPAFNIPVKL